MTDLLFRQCENERCRLRYPVSAETPRGHRCPACGAPAGVVAIVPARSEPAAAGIAPGGRAEPPLHGLLDNVRSLFNVGSIFRSADGSGFAHLYLCGFTPTPDNPKLAKTALGAEHSVPWSHQRNSLDLAGALLEQGYVLWALEEGETAQPIDAAPPRTRPTVLVVGNEVAGIDPGLLARCERTLCIPMRGHKRSLNVATAFGVAAVLLAAR